MRRRRIRRALCIAAVLVMAAGLTAAGVFLTRKIRSGKEAAPAQETPEKPEAQEEPQAAAPVEPEKEVIPEEEPPADVQPQEPEEPEKPEEPPMEPFRTEPIANVEALDTTSQGWGQGPQTDEQNRPVSCLGYQEKYGKYQAYFIGEGEKTIYLTFDEGYENGYTGRILDVLKEKGVQAVFFVTEPYAKQNPELVQRMIDEGHAVGNHSVTHPSDGLPALSIEKQQQEIRGCHDYIKENFGYDMHLFRYPAGKFSEQSLAVINNCNYKSVFWSFAYLDYDVNQQPERQAALQKVISNLHPGAIYLLHAVSATNTDILGEFIDKTREAGYSFARFE